MICELPVILIKELLHVQVIAIGKINISIEAGLIIFMAGL